MKKIRGRRTTVNKDKKVSGGVITIRIPRKKHIQIANTANKLKIPINTYLIRLIDADLQTRN